MELIIATSTIGMVIIILLQATRCARPYPDHLSGNRWYYSKFLLIAFWFTLTFVSAFREGFQDTGVYKNLYTYIGTDFNNAFNKDFAIQDYGFNLLMVFLNRINSDPQLLIIVSAVIILGVQVYVIAKHASDLPFSLFLFLCVAFIGTMNGIRQILAASVLTLAWPFLRDRKILPYMLVVGIASTLHASAIVMAPLYFVIAGKRLNKGILIFTVLVLLCFLFPSAAYRVMGSVLEDSLYEDYLENESKMGIMRFLVELVPVIISLLYCKIYSRSLRHAEDAHQRMIDIMINMQIVSFGFTALGLQMVYFARICLYFSMVLPLLLPQSIDGTFEKKSADMVKAIATVMYLFYFCYQVYTYERIDGWGGMELIF